MRPTTERTPSLRWLVPRNPGAASASAATASCGTFDGPEPKRPSRGRRSAGSSMDGFWAVVFGGALTESR